MAVAFESFASRVNAAATTWTGDRPATVANGDYLYGQVFNALNAAATPTTAPTDWVLIQGPTDASTAGTTWYYRKRVTDAVNEPASYVWTSTSGGQTTVVIARISGVHATAPEDASGRQPNNTVTTAVATPDITSLGADRLLLICASSKSFDGVASATHTFSPETEAWDVQYGGAAGAARTVAGGFQLVGAGAVGSRTITMSFADESAGFSALLAPDSAPSDTTPPAAPTGLTAVKSVV